MERVPSSTFPYLSHLPKLSPLSTSSGFAMEHLCFSIVLQPYLPRSPTIGPIMSTLSCVGGPRSLFAYSGSKADLADVVVRRYGAGSRTMPAVCAGAPIRTVPFVEALGNPRVPFSLVF